MGGDIPPEKDQGRKNSRGIFANGARSTCRCSTFPCLPIKDSRWTRSARIRLRGQPRVYRPITA